MEQLIAKIESNPQFRPSSVDLADFDIVLCPKRHLSGIALTNSVLMLEVRHMYSFRAQLPNLDGIPLVLLKRRDLVDRDMLERYFEENRDNPYALFHAISQLAPGAPITHLIQFPPLFYSKTQSRFDRLAEAADVGDAIFTFDRESNLSRMIRTVDYSHWSHTAVVAAKGRIVDLTTSGLREASLASLNTPSLDIGLYRPRTPPTPEQKAVIREYIQRSLVEGRTYSWIGVLRIYLNKRWRLPIKRPISPADLIYNNALDLVAYACTATWAASRVARRTLFLVSVQRISSSAMPAHDLLEGRLRLGSEFPTTHAKRQRGSAIIMGTSRTAESAAVTRRAAVMCRAFKMLDVVAIIHQPESATASVLTPWWSAGTRIWISAQTACEWLRTYQPLVSE